jgi:hypothetical protein
MACSFTPQGDWFVFDTETSKTLQRGFKSKVHAVNWMISERVGASRRPT